MRNILLAGLLLSTILLCATSGVLYLIWWLISLTTTFGIAPNYFICLGVVFILSLVF